MTDASMVPSSQGVRETPRTLTIEFHSAGYFHPDAVVCSAKQAESLAREIDQLERELQQARGEALEEAAGICSTIPIADAPNSVDLCDRIRRAIRALKPSPASGEQIND